MSPSTKSAVITLALLSACGAVFGCRPRRDAPPNFRSSAGTSGAVEASADDPAALDGRARVQGTSGERDGASSAAKGNDGGLLPPLAVTGELVDLVVPGFGSAVVSVPVGSRAARPVMLAVHGNYDSPDFQCALWRSMVRDRGFILCPRGVARRDSPGPDDIRYTYEGKFAAELDAAIAALRDRFGAWVDPGPMIYVGFSLGAILARAYVMRAPSRFDRLILVEGGASGWDAKAMSKAGAARMLWACGQSPCVDAGRAAADAFERTKVPSKVVYAKGAGHTYGGPVAELVRAEWEWLVTGDARWSP